MPGQVPSVNDLELGFKSLSDGGPVEPQIAAFRALVHETNDVVEPDGGRAGSASRALPADGVTQTKLDISVTDQNGNPLSGQTVRFVCSYVHPRGNWRTAPGMNRLYSQNNGDGNMAERLVESGVIRVLGTLSRDSATTNSRGVASIRYRTSHIGSNFSQAKIAQERVVATLENGKRRAVELDIGRTDFKEVPQVAGGLRVLGATGRHVDSRLFEFLKQLGDMVRASRWAHPVTVTAASLRWGGQYPPHFSHKDGLTLDLRPMSKDGERTYAKQDGVAATNYDSERTKQLIELLKQTGGTVYFNGKGSGGQYRAGHDNHIHVSWLRHTLSVVEDSIRTIT